MNTLFQLHFEIFSYPQESKAPIHFIFNPQAGECSPEATAGDQTDLIADRPFRAAYKYTNYEKSFGQIPPSVRLLHQKPDDVNPDAYSATCSRGLYPDMKRTKASPRLNLWI